MNVPRLPRRIRLAAGYALLVTAVEALVAIGVTFAWRQSEMRSFDARLLGLAYDASQRLADDPAKGSAAIARDTAARGREVLYVEVADEDGKTLGCSDAELGRLLGARDGRKPPERATFDDVALESPPPGVDTDRVVRRVALPFHDADGDVYVIHALARTTGAGQLGRDLAARLAWIVPLGLVAAFAAAWYLERRTLRPVQAVADAAAEVSPETLRRGIDVAGAEGEIAHLQASLNDALRRLDDAFEAQSRFAANVSHELKTPIAVLLAQAQVLDAESPVAEDVTAFRDSVEAELRRLGRTVESFLVLARPGADARLERAEPTPLLDVVVESVRVGEPLAKQYGVRLVPRVEIADDERAPVVRGDADLLRTMLDNLLANAIRHSPHDEAIDVRLSTTASEARVTVRDRGPGIPVEYLEKVFDRFVQAPVSAPRSGGTGLGLNIAATVARVHGGTLVARNRSDRGCEFEATLPLA